jgi:hypothetical protein
MSSRVNFQPIGAINPCLYGYFQSDIKQCTYASGGGAAISFENNEGVKIQSPLTTSSGSSEGALVAKQASLFPW